MPRRHNNHITISLRQAFFYKCVHDQQWQGNPVLGCNPQGGTWFETGAEMLNGGTLNYFAVPWAVLSNPLPLFIVAVVELGLMGAVETYRQRGEGPAGYAPGVGNFDASIYKGLDRLVLKFTLLRTA